MGMQLLTFPMISGASTVPEFIVHSASSELHFDKPMMR
jgi:hypothetical protein